MSATGYTPISLYYSTTASAVPVNTNLVNGELAINITDGKLYYKDNGGTVRLLASNATSAPVLSFQTSLSGLTPSTATTGVVTLAGTLGTSSGGTNLTSFTSGGAMYATSTSVLTTGTLPNTAGGTGQSSAFTQYGITYASTTTALATTAAGTSTTVLHGNASGAPTFGAVSLTADVSGTLPVGSGGSGAVTLTGILKGNGTSAFTAATAGTDYVAPGTATTFTATQTFAGSSSVEAMKTSNIAEVDTISATAATGTINYDITTQSVLYYTSNASANWTVNFRGSSGTSLNTLMATGESISATFLVTQGSTAYYNSAVTIDGTSVTPKWQGGTAPTSGNASSVDCYTYVIQKTASATYTVLASQTKFA